MVVYQPDRRRRVVLVLLVSALLFYTIENPVRMRRMWKGRHLYVWLVVLAVAAFAGHPPIGAQRPRWIRSVLEDV